MITPQEKKNYYSISIKRRTKLSKMNNNDDRNIDMGYGNRTLHITSMNVDTLRTKESISNLILNLETNKVDITRIQETHNDRTDNISVRNYTIFFGGNEKISESIHETEIDTKSGVAIILRKNPPHQINK